jgi:hypothetical protein
MSDNGEYAKLIDFGLSRAMESKPGLTTTTDYHELVRQSWSSPTTPE